MAARKNKDDAMYSLTIHFGPNAVCWALLFKDEEKAGQTYNAFVDARRAPAEKTVLIGSDDFGQSFAIPADEISGVLLEDLEQVEAARIQRSLAEERCKVKLMEAARSDPVIGAAIRQQRGAPVLTPMGGFRQ
jgi:hypothetical protein